MIWYLLYPLRGTTEAPVLPTSHPLRKAFAHHGRYVSQHVVTTLLMWSAVTVILIYPIPFLFTTDFTNGASNVPQHVWTVAQPLPYDAATEPDIIMRSIWVHADYMRALNPALLGKALELQDELLGTTQDFDPRAHAGIALPGQIDSDLTPAQRDAVHVSNGLTNQSWFFHSPLLYWGCSGDRIWNDPDIISTINDKKNQSTTVNVTLRHSIVFSGKRFEDRRLLAADALVITLLHLRDSPVGRLWEKRAPEIAKTFADAWDIYPADGHVSASQLYEFQFRPLSAQDIVTLTLAYGITVLYFMASLNKLRAFNSRLGLTVTVATQITLSIMSSFTVCAIFNIDLSRMPHYAYPVVVFAMSLESIFRLINAVIRTPAEESTSSRIGHAYGETALTALTSTIQNVLILLGLSRVVSASVEAFCYFAASAILFNFFYLSTFFLSVLSVDVRRTELSDALAKSMTRRSRKAAESQAPSSWLGQFLQGKTALSTRVAGTFIMVGFVIIAQWHFFGENPFKSLLWLAKGRDTIRGLGTSRPSMLEDVHQASSLTAWLRLQDHETAREVINIIKPSTYSYIARVYDPLVFVTKNADRVPHSKKPTFLPAAYDFVHHELTRFIAVVLVVISAVRLLCSYLLWEDEAAKESHQDSDASLLSLRSLVGGHELDVVILKASLDGHIISVGLDRTIRVWDIRCEGSSYALKGEDIAEISVLAVAIDDESRWLAILSPSKVVFWDLKEQRFGQTTALSGSSQRPVAFFLHQVGQASEESAQARLVIVRKQGIVFEVSPDDGVVSDEVSICSDPWVSVQPVSRKGTDTSPPGLYLVAISGTENTYLATKTDRGWKLQNLTMTALLGQNVHQVIGLSPGGLFMAATADNVHLLSAQYGTVLHTFGTAKMQTGSLQCAYSFHRSSQDGKEGITSLVLCYNAKDTGDCIIESFSPSENADAISALASDSPGEAWCDWRAATKATRRVSNPGSSEVLFDGSVLGIRHQRHHALHAHKMELNGMAGGLRRRSPKGAKGHEALRQWEVWTESPAGRLDADEHRPLFDETEQAGYLIVSDLGPKVRVGSSSVAFAFGTVVKMATRGGEERWGSSPGDKDQSSSMNVTGRRRKAANGYRNSG